MSTDEVDTIVFVSSDNSPTLAKKEGEEEGGEKGWGGGNKTTRKPSATR